MFEMPWLALLQFIPLAGAAWVYRLGETPRALRVGVAVALVELGLALGLFAGLDVHDPAFQYVEALPLAGPLVYHAGADGFTVLFVLLTAFIITLIPFYARVRGLDRQGRLLSLILLVEAAMMTELVTLNLLWFTLASMVELGLIAYLVGQWSFSPERALATSRYLQFQGVGMALLLGGTLLVAWAYHDTTGLPWTFDLQALAQHPVTGPLGDVAFFLLFYGLGVRTPIFPFHGWLRPVALYGDMAVAPALLLGVKIGIYALVRFVLPLLPDAATRWYPYVAAFAVTGVFYAALLALLRVNLRSLIAFAVVSHTSLVILGLFSLDAMAIQGSVLLAVNFGLAAVTMLFITGLVYRRTHTTTLSRLGGLFDRIPLLALTFLVAGLAILGMPGTPGFDAAHLVLESAIHRFGALTTVAAALGNVLAAGFLLWTFQRAFLAPTPPWRKTAVERATSLELAIAGSLVLVMMYAGFRMEPLLVLVDAPARALGLKFG